MKIFDYIDFLVDKVLFRIESWLGKRPIYEARDGLTTVRVYKDNTSTYLTFGGKLIQSYSSTDQKNALTVWNAFSLAPYFFTPVKATNDQFRLCILGFGAGIAAKFYKADYPNCTITGVEVNKYVVEAVKKYFKLPSNCELITADAEVFITETKQTYDIILVDLFNKNQTIDLVGDPKFLSIVFAKLNAEGVVVINHIGKKSQRQAILAHVDTLSSSIFTLDIKKSAISNTFIFATTSRQSLKDLKRYMLADDRLSTSVMRNQSAEAIKQVK